MAAITCKHFQEIALVVIKINTFSMGNDTISRRGRKYVMYSLLTTCFRYCRICVCVFITGVGRCVAFKKKIQFLRIEMTISHFVSLKEFSIMPLLSWWYNLQI